mmetsp:Transcript_77/g.249  ORF Transcript_77/g.249 Transcript_77/m.249 type:complete len:293 (-) Transcript_77:1232-2110(-)
MHPISVTSRLLCASRTMTVCGRGVRSAPTPPAKTSAATAARRTIDGIAALRRSRSVGSAPRRVAWSSLELRRLRGARDAIAVKKGASTVAPHACESGWTALARWRLTTGPNTKYWLLGAERRDGLDVANRSTGSRHQRFAARPDIRLGAEHGRPRRRAFVAPTGPRAARARLAAPEQAVQELVGDGHRLLRDARVRRRGRGARRGRAARRARAVRVLGVRGRMRREPELHAHVLQARVRRARGQGDGRLERSVLRGRGRARDHHGPGRRRRKVDRGKIGPDARRQGRRRQSL